MLDVRAVDVILGGTPVLHDVNLSVATGESVAVLGPSGSGKSTLLRAIAGLVPVEKGSISWDGAEVTDVPTHQRGFGLMFQGYALFPHLDVAGNVGFGLRMMNVPPAQIEHRVAESLELVGLAEFGSRSIADLSGGERQRVALARTLAPEPRLIMLDEPAGGVNLTMLAYLKERLVAYNAEHGTTFVVIEHNMEFVMSLCSRILVLAEGRIIAEGPPEAIRANQQVIDSYLGG